LYFEDFERDRRFTSGSRTITEQDVMDFALLTGDVSGVHTSDEVARQSEFGRRIAHGALVFGIAVGLTTGMALVDDSLIAFAGVDHLRFVRPVFITDTLRVAKRVIESRPIDARRGVIVFETKVTNQHSNTVLMYHDKLLLKRRPAEVGEGR
jgi:acyl dehydratase